MATPCHRAAPSRGAGQLGRLAREQRGNRCEGKEWEFQNMKVGKGNSNGTRGGTELDSGGVPVPCKGLGERERER